MEKKELDLDCLSDMLIKSTVLNESGLSFAGRSLFKNNELEDAKEVVDEINKCESLEFLNLEGNSLGVVAAEEISKALMTRSEFKRAIWKDMFTGRLKTEIPKALKFLGRALITANARLVVLDLSDNASGPIGVEGFKELLTSPTCYTLKELKLNNMGLGITGGKMLASALMECYNKSKEDGTPLCLRVFIAGRNRLENEGATALAAVFKALKSLEVVSIPQNGIYSAGVKALSSAFAENKNLRQIDLNDNTVSPKGAKDLAAILGELKSLNTLDLGDCLLKSEGVTCMADKLSTLPNLEVLNLSYNEIGAEAGLELVKGLANNSSLKKINLNGNQFGMQGCDSIKETMNSYGKTQILDSLSEDEGDSDEDEEDAENEDDELDAEEDDLEEESDEQTPDGDSETESSGDEPAHIQSGVSPLHSVQMKSGVSPLHNVHMQSGVSPLHNVHMQSGVSPMHNVRFQTGVSPLHNMQPQSGISPMQRGQLEGGVSPMHKTQVTAAMFLEQPTAENLLSLRPNVAEKIIEELKAKPEKMQLDHMIVAIMRVSSLTIDIAKDVRETAMSCSETLYKELFVMVQERNAMSHINNTLPVYLGLIKNEEKSNMKKKYNHEGCMNAVQNAIKKMIMPHDIRNILEIFMKRDQQLTK